MFFVVHYVLLVFFQYYLLVCLEMRGWKILSGVLWILCTKKENLNLMNEYIVVKLKAHKLIFFGNLLSLNVDFDFKSQLIFLLSKMSDELSTCTFRLLERNLLTNKHYI